MLSARNTKGVIKNPLKPSNRRSATGPTAQLPVLLHPIGRKPAPDAPEIAATPPFGASSNEDDPSP